MIYASAAISFEYRVRSNFDVLIKYHNYFGIENEELTFNRGEEPNAWYQKQFVVEGNKFGISGIVESGIGFKISNSVLVKVAPSLIYSFRSEYRYPIKENLYSAGLKFGINFMF